MVGPDLREVSAAQRGEGVHLVRVRVRVRARARARARVRVRARVSAPSVAMLTASPAAQLSSSVLTPSSPIASKSHTWSGRDRGDTLG